MQLPSEPRRDTKRRQMGTMARIPYPMTKDTKVDELLRLAEDGPVRSRDVAAAGIPRAYLTRLVDRGLLVRSSRGVYRLADAELTELHALSEVAVRAPGAVICLLSALAFHGLTTQLPHAVWVMLGHKARPPKLEWPRLEVVRASGRALSHGVEAHSIEGVDVRVTSAAKTVADCFRYRGRVGLDVALEALRDYLKPPRRRRAERTVDALISAARADRVETVMRPYLEALA